MAGFGVDPYENYYDLEQKESKFENMITGHVPSGACEKMQSDAVFYFVHMKGYAQENVVRFDGTCGGNPIVTSMPGRLTVGISLFFTTPSERSADDAHFMDC